VHDLFETIAAYREAKNSASPPKQKHLDYYLKARTRPPTRPEAGTLLLTQTVTPQSSTAHSDLHKCLSFELNDLLPSDLQNSSPSYQEIGQVWEYLGSIGEHLLALETKFPLPSLNYSTYFGPTQRVRGVSLISACCTRLGLQLETQFLAFDLFHRICTAAPFERYHSALKAATSLYVAAKYAEVCPPRASLFANFDPIQQVLPENIIKL
jgi:hypothetical protein